MRCPSTFFKFVVLVLTHAMLVTDAAPRDYRALDGKQSNVKNQATKVDINGMRAAFLEKYKDVFKIVNKIDKPVEEATNVGFKASGKEDGTYYVEPRDENEIEGLFQADIKLTDEQRAEIYKTLEVDDDEVDESDIVQENDDDVDDSDNDDDDDNNDNSDDGYKTTRRAKRKATTLAESLWPLGVIPVELDLDGVIDETTWELFKAMDHWMDKTCLLFVIYNPYVAEFLHHDNRLTFVRGSGCWSYIGRVSSIPGSQELSIGPGCGDFGTLLHEIGHAIGFFHEQSRFRSKFYIDVHYENIKKEFKGNFRRFGRGALNTYGVPYDLASIMHYGARAFSKNGEKTITTKHPEDQHVIGQRKGLSPSDIQMTNMMYNSECERRETY